MSGAVLGHCLMLAIPAVGMALGLAAERPRLGYALAGAIGAALVSALFLGHAAGSEWVR